MIEFQTTTKAAGGGSGINGNYSKIADDASPVGSYGPPTPTPQPPVAALNEDELLLEKALENPGNVKESDLPRLAELYLADPEKYKTFCHAADTEAGKTLLKAVTKTMVETLKIYVPLKLSADQKTMMMSMINHYRTAVGLDEYTEADYENGLDSDGQFTEQGLVVAFGGSYPDDSTIALGKTFSNYEQLAAAMRKAGFNEDTVFNRGLSIAYFKDADGNTFAVARDDKTHLYTITKKP